jgi:hypothetical protein
MIHRPTPRTDLQGVPAIVETDLDRSDSSELPDVGWKLRQEHLQERHAGGSDPRLVPLLAPAISFSPGSSSGTI